MIEIIKISATDHSIINDLIPLIRSEEGHGEQPTVESLQKLFDDDRSYLFGAIIDGITAGYALAYRFPSLYSEGSLAYLYDIEVLEAHRRKGIGKKLIAALLENLKADGVRELWLGTAVNNKEGQALFTATGAEKSGETFNDYTYNLD